MPGFIFVAKMTKHALKPDLGISPPKPGGEIWSGCIKSSP